VVKSDQRTAQMTRIQGIAAILLATLGGVSAPSLAAAQTHDYPQRPIRLIVCFTPGGSTDLVGRLYTQAKFDVQRDLEPLARVATTPYVMVAHPSLGVKTVAELIAYAKPRSGKISSCGAACATKHRNRFGVK
jgi:tripartite-type tricarboxylate transporter receptor subunit TctC